MKNAMMMLATTALVLGSASAFANGAAAQASKPAMGGIKVASATTQREERLSKKHSKKKEVKPSAETVKQ